MRSRSKLPLIQRIVLIMLATVLVVLTVAVSAQFLNTSEHDQVVESLKKSSEELIEKSQAWYVNQDIEVKTFNDLSFESLGYLDKINFNKRVLIEPNGRFTLIIGPKGESFDLLAESSDGIMVMYRGIKEDGIPEPEIY